MSVAAGEHGRDERSQILKSTAVIGSSTLISMLLGLVRGKVAALLLGPAGVGLIGILNNLLSTSANVASLGIGPSGVRHVSEAAAKGDATAIAEARHALLVGLTALAVLAGIVIFTARASIARLVLDDPTLSPWVGWIALGVALQVAASAQGAILNGMRRIGDLAVLTIGSALVSTFLGIAAIAAWGKGGLIVLILAGPAATFLVGHALLHRLHLPGAAPTVLESLRRCSKLVRLGLSFLLAGLALGGGLLVLRTLVLKQLGAPALGLFEAAWAITMAYLGTVMTAMGTDFYPRLTGLIERHDEASALVNEQTRVALWLCGPLCIGVIAFAPLVLRLLYADAFTGAADVLRLLVLGDLLKIVSWPLGFVLLATGDGRRFVIGEAVAVFLMVAVAFIGLQWGGLPAVGWGYLAMYAVYLPLVYAWAGRKIGFRWDAGVWRDWLTLLGAAVLTAVTARFGSPFLSAAVGASLAALFAALTLRRLARLLPNGGRVGRLVHLARRVSGKERNDG